MRGSISLAALLLACHAPAQSPDPARQAPADEIRLEPASPKLGYLGFDTVRGRSERVVAVLPAQLVMDEDHTVRMMSPVTGRIGRLLASQGDRVAAGQPLALITSGDLAQATSDAEKAEAALAQATAALARSRDLFSHQVIARKDLEQAESDAAAARAEAARARARVTMLGGSAAEAEFALKAPLRGEVVDRSANPGQEVRPDGGEPLFVISALDTLWLTASVYQRDLAAVRPGDKLVFSADAVPGRSFTATIRYVSGALDPVTRTATLRAVLANPHGELKPAMFGEARVLAPDHGGEPVIPTTALVTQGNGSVVFVQLAPGRFVRRPVTVSTDDGQLASVASGLRLGDVIVTRGSILLAAELAQGS